MQWVQNMNKRNAAIISAGLVLFTVLSLFFLNRSTGDRLFLAHKGIINTESWDYHDGMIKLAGEWEFYPDQFIYPQRGEDVFSRLSDKVKYVQVPGDWNKYEEKNRPVGNIGTYRVTITVPYDGSFGIKTSAVSYAYTVYINGIKVCESGRIAENIKDYIPDNQVKIGMENTRDKSVELVIHVANYMANTGGVLQPFTFGTEKQLVTNKDRNTMLDALLVSGYFILGIYYAGCFAQRKKAGYLLYFSLFAILQGIYASTLNGRIIGLIISVYPNMEVYFCFQIHIMYLSVFFFLMFVYDFFKVYVSKKIVAFLSVLLLIIGPILIWIPYGSMYSTGITAYEHLLIITFILGVSYLYIFWSMMKAVYRGAEASGYILLVVMSFACYVVTLCMEVLFRINIGRVMVALFLVMLLFISFMMTYTFQLAYEQTDRLTDQLLTYDKMRDKFINKVSLELLKPLQSILNMSEALFNEKGLNGYQKQNVLRINSEGKQVLNIVEEIKEISGIQEGETDILKQEVKFEEIREIVEELTYLRIYKEQIQIKNEVPVGLPSVYADNSKLKRILYHLISNGVKFTEKGEISISAEVNEGKAYIFVKDTGIGIDKSKWNIIFNSFYQAESSYENDNTGLGIGLSIVNNLVKLHGGKIWVVSEPGKGSKFTFTLPLFKGESSIKEDPQKALKGSAEMSPDNQEAAEDMVWREMTVSKEKAGNTIMVISDSESEQKFFMHLLNSMGDNAIFSFNEKDIMELLEKEKVDTVIIKADFEKNSSMDLCTKIRKNYTLAELPVLVLSDRNNNEAQKYLSLGANDYLKKPYETDELKARIHMLLMVKKSATEALNQELNSLQAQIMPHFLYNTLNTIIGLSFKDKDKTFEALQNLSTYFRAKLDFKGYQSFVTLRNEVELMRAYLSIERIRYGERLDIGYDIDESIYLLLPSLTLQPLVENAVNHSINTVNKVQIQIKIYRKAEMIFINIKDNGPGMTREKQEELLSGNNQRIGFSNVMNRLKLMKGSQLTIESSVNMGTSITITLPEVTR